MGNGWTESTMEESKRLDILASALEVDCVADTGNHEELAAKLEQAWRAGVPQAQADRLAWMKAKLVAVQRFGGAMRKLTKDNKDPAYGALNRVCQLEPSYLVRREAILAFGLGGKKAYRALRQGSTPTFDDDSPPSEEEKKWMRWRKEVVHMWLLPLLFGSVERAESEHLELKDKLRRAVEGARSRHWPISLEVALAQGFKHAANRRRRHPYTVSENRTFLREQSIDLLERSRFWYSQLTLLHALCLWSLPDSPDENRRRREYSSEPKKLVQHWLAIAGTSPPDRGGRDTEAVHPSVAEAAGLVVKALRMGDPEPFVWMDERETINNVGSRPAKPDVRRVHNLWVPPSNGWSVLEPRAQRLIADVTLLWNLAERDDEVHDAPSRHEELLGRQNRPELPPCLTGTRESLAPGYTIGMVNKGEPGSNCKHGCPFQLCPYPPKGMPTDRFELNDAFCQRQQSLVRHPLRLPRRRARWQGAYPWELARFWGDMVDRARR